MVSDACVQGVTFESWISFRKSKTWDLSQFRSESQVTDADIDVKYNGVPSYGYALPLLNPSPFTRLTPTGGLASIKIDCVYISETPEREKV